MGVNDAAEQLEVAIEEVGKLEREVAELRTELNYAEKILDAHAQAVPQLVAERDAAFATVEMLADWGQEFFGSVRWAGGLDDTESESGLSPAAILSRFPADALAEHDRTVKAEALEEAAALREAEYRKATREMGFKRQFLGEWLPETPTLAEQHTTALAEQSAHYRDNPMNSDDGRDE